MDHPLAENIQVHTFGCKVNTYDSGLIEKNIKNYSQAAVAENKPFSKSAPIHILNTCAVTAEATKEALRYIRRLKSKEPLCTIVVTGCAAQVDTGAFENLPGADLVVANSHKSQLPFLLDQYFKGTLQQKTFKSNIFQKEDLESGGGQESHHTRSFLKIQDGCNSFCTYCVIPFARGKSRSLGVQDLIEKVNMLHAEGVREVVLTGVHIGDYEDTWRGSKAQLEDLVEALLLHTSMPRFRLSSLEPVEVSDRLLDLYKDSRLCPHFHMSIQSANTSVLEKMKRKYTQQDVMQSLEKIYKKIPQVHVGMDVIVGFPNETDELFLDTYQTLQNLPWTKIHVFPYSERPGTKAMQYTETVRREVRLQRAAQLRHLSQARYGEEAHKQLGQIKKVLLLKNSNKNANALSRDYWQVQVESDPSSTWLSGTEVQVRLKDYIQGVSTIGEGYFSSELVMAEGL